MGGGYEPPAIPAVDILDLLLVPFTKRKFYPTVSGLMPEQRLESMIISH